MMPAQAMRLRKLWDPSMLVSPAAIWLDHTSAVTDVSGNASQWNDKTANGWHFSQSTAGSRPLIVASGVNGLRTLRFDGVNDLMTCAVAGSTALMQNKTAGWALAVMKKTAIDGSPLDKCLFWGAKGDSLSVRFALQPGSSFAANRPHMGVRRLDADAFAHIESSTTIDAAFHMMLFQQNWSTGAGSIHLDGTQVASNATLTSAGSTSNTAAFGNLSIGATPDASGRFLDADVAAFIVGNGALPSSAEVDRLFGWAAHTYGLTSLLPAGHPYKVVRP